MKTKATDEIKSSMLTLALCTCIVSAFIIKCTSPASAENTQKTTVIKNKITADNTFIIPEYNNAYLQDVEDYRLETGLRIAGNEQLISEMKMRMKKESLNGKITHEIKLAELERKNFELKKKMSEYEPNGENDWMTFKNNVNHELRQVSKDLKIITVFTIQ